MRMKQVKSRSLDFAQPDAGERTKAVGTSGDSGDGCNEG